MSTNVQMIIALQQEYGQRLLVGAKEPEISIIADAGGRAGRPLETRTFENDDPRMPAHVRSMLNLGYCVGIVPAGANEVVVFSGPTFRFNFRTRVMTSQRPSAVIPPASQNLMSSGRSSGTSSVDDEIAELHRAADRKLLMFVVLAVLVMGGAVAWLM